MLGGHAQPRNSQGRHHLIWRRFFISCDIREGTMSGETPKKPSAKRCTQLSWR